MPRLVTRVTVWWALSGGVILLAVVLVTTTNAGAFALDKLARPFGWSVAGLPGYEDFVRLAVSAAGLMFFPYCQLRRGHLAVNLIAHRFSRQLRRSLGALAQLGTALLALFLGYWMVLGMLETRGDNALSRVLGWPEWPFYVPGIFSMLLWALIALLQILEGEPSR